MRSTTLPQNNLIFSQCVGVARPGHGKALEQLCPVSGTLWKSRRGCADSATKLRELKKMNMKNRKECSDLGLPEVF